jgi:tRNA-splicing endonuclease subunit Sen2
MSEIPDFNGRAVAVEQTPSGTSSSMPFKTAETSVQNKKPNQRKRKPNYALIHSKPLPLNTFALPSFHPTNPISLFRVAYAILSQFFRPPSSHPSAPYNSYLSLETRAIQVTDPRQVRALWEMGFFGKGTLSRSEPSWRDREEARLKAKRSGGGTAEEVTNARREKRRAFKLERARLEREKIEMQRLVEEGRLDPSALNPVPVIADDSAANSKTAEVTESSSPALKEQGATVSDAQPITSNSVGQICTESAITSGAADRPANVENLDLVEFAEQEHLQLTFEEAFFLAYGLGVLAIEISPESATAGKTLLDTSSNSALLRIFSNLTSFPPRPLATPLRPDDPFLLSYVVYHHFRSLGWVVRGGVKFAVDYMLYNRGPAFSHAEFAVIILPAYSHAYWSTDQGKAERSTQRDGEDRSREWWWLHCVNRVQSQVLKSLVLVYVDVPPPSSFLRDAAGEVTDLGGMLRSYKIREFVLKRWVANRTRN